MKEGAEAAGRNPDDIDRMIEIKISYDPDPRAGAGEHPVLGTAVADRRAEALASTTRSRWRRPPTRCPSSRSPSAGSSRRIPTRPSRRSRHYVDWGLNHLVFHAPGHDQRRFLELFQKDLEPGCADSDELLQM